MRHRRSYYTHTYSISAGKLPNASVEEEKSALTRGQKNLERSVEHVGGSTLLAFSESARRGVVSLRWVQ